MKLSVHPPACLSDESENSTLRFDELYQVERSEHRKYVACSCREVLKTDLIVRFSILPAVFFFSSRIRTLKENNDSE